MPHTLDDLKSHYAVHYFSSRSGRNCNWDFVIDGKTREIDVPGCVSVNDWSAHLACALQGFGLVQTARFMALPHLQAGELIDVLPQWKQRPEIGRASWGKEGVRTCRSRWSPYH